MVIKLEDMVKQAVAEAFNEQQAEHEMTELTAKVEQLEKDLKKERFSLGISVLTFFLIFVVIMKVLEKVAVEIDEIKEYAVFRKRKDDK